MSEVRVAVLGASGWMGKVHTMAYQTFPHFFGVSDGTARIVTLVDGNPSVAENLANRAPVQGSFRIGIRPLPIPTST